MRGNETIYEKEITRVFSKHPPSVMYIRNLSANFPVIHHSVHDSRLITCKKWILNTFQFTQIATEIKTGKMKQIRVPIKLCMKSNLQVFGLAITLVDVNHMAGTLVSEFNSDIKALTLLQIFIKQRFAN